MHIKYPIINKIQIYFLRRLPCKNTSNSSSFFFLITKISEKNLLLITRVRGTSGTSKNIPKTKQSKFFGLRICLCHPIFICIFIFIIHANQLYLMSYYVSIYKRVSYYLVTLCSFITRSRQIPPSFLQDHQVRNINALQRVMDQTCNLPLPSFAFF